MTNEVLTPQHADGDGEVSDLDHYDILILDASLKQSLASARSLGRTHLRVALGEASSQCRPHPPLPAFRSRYCAEAVLLPDYTGDPAPYVAAVIEFAALSMSEATLLLGSAMSAATWDQVSLDRSCGLY